MNLTPEQQEHIRCLDFVRSFRKREPEAALKAVQHATKLRMPEYREAARERVGGKDAFNAAQREYRKNLSPEKRAERLKKQAARMKALRARRRLEAGM